MPTGVAGQDRATRLRWKQIVDVSLSVTRRLVAEQAKLSGSTYMPFLDQTTSPYDRSKHRINASFSRRLLAESHADYLRSSTAEIDSKKQTPARVGSLATIHFGDGRKCASDKYTRYLHGSPSQHDRRRMWPQTPLVWTSRRLDRGNDERCGSLAA